MQSSQASPMLRPKTWLALFRREWLEHQTSYLWAPIGTFALIVVAVLLALAFGQLGRVDLAGVTDMPDQGDGLRGQLQLLLASKDIDIRRVETGFARGMHSLGTVFVLLYFAVVALALLGSLFDDRRDRTVLFWKSIPVSDAQTVLSKLISAVWLAPMVYVVALVVSQVFLLSVASFYLSGSDGFSASRMWGDAGLLGTYFTFVLGFLVQGFWALPIWGWIVFVSAAVKRSPLFYAGVLPLALIVIEWAVFDSSVVNRFIRDHIAGRALPLPYEDNQGVSRIADAGDILSLWLTAEMWIGIVIGGALIAGAIYLRRRNNEI